MVKYSSDIGLIYQALSDPHRRAMVDRLVRGPASVSELASPLPMSMPAVVQHLKLLENSGLVRSSKVGRVRTCQIAPEALEAAEDWIARRRQYRERQLDKLETYLETSNDKEKNKNRSSK